MTEQPKPPPGRLAEFLTYHVRPRARGELAVESEVFGMNAGITSYTTPEQAELLAEALGLRPGVRALDVGSGAGWPALWLAERTGCEVFLTDVPFAGLRRAREQSRQRAVTDRCAILAAGGAHLPFRPRAFGAVLHTDVL